MSDEIKDEISFELRLENAKELLEKLSNPEITLSDSVSLYKNGLKEIEEAQKLLESAKLEFSVSSEN